MFPYPRNTSLVLIVRPIVPHYLRTRQTVVVVLVAGLDTVARWCADASFWRRRVAQRQQYRADSLAGVMSRDVEDAIGAPYAPILV
jgi:hypothetical protein